MPKRKHFRLSALLVALASMPLCPLVSHALTLSDPFEQLGTLIGVTNTSENRPTGISGDGSIVVGYSSGDYSASPNSYIYHAFKWTAVTGIRDLGTLSDTGGVPDNNGESRAFGISADGSTIVGSSLTVGRDDHAVYWKAGTGIVDMGTIAGHTSRAYAVSANGSVIVGTSTIAGDGYRAFRWQAGPGMVALPTLGGSSASALGVSADGSVIVGSSFTTRDAHVHAFRWVSDTTTDLGTLSGGNTSIARSVSADGTVAVGYSSNAGDFGQIAVRWDGVTITSLGTLGGATSDAAAISSNGLVIVGSAQNLEGATHAVRWVGGTIQTVAEWLRANSVTVPSDITLSALATNSDGSVVAGMLDNEHHNLAYIARVTSSGSGSGGNGLLVLDGNTAASLGSSSTVISTGFVPQGGVVHGAHSRPLSYRIPSGKSAFWAAGDWGKDEHMDRDGNLGLAEMGAAWNLGTLQLDLSAGRTWDSLATVFDGSIDATGTYMLAESIIPIKGNLWGVLTGYYNWGNADIRRGYLNAGTPDHSNAATDTRTWSVRARLELDDLFKIGGIKVSPYGEVSHTNVRMDGYTETGGGFPAAYGGRLEQATDLRYGMNCSKPVSGNTNLLGMVEGVHRFDRYAADVTGEVLGAGGFSFSFPGRKYQQNWLRGGVGFESQFSGSTVSLMLNATTEGQMPSAWLAARFQKAF